MKYILFLALLPCLSFADDQIGSVYCPDGTECEFGKTCCVSKNRQTYECCDLAKEDLQSKKLVLAIRPSSAQNISLASTPNNLQHLTCFGTRCGSTHCCDNKYSATCCSNPAYCCPSGARCCTNFYDFKPWCCQESQRCHSDFGYCKLVSDGENCCLEGSSRWCCGKGYRCGSSYGYCILVPDGENCCLEGSSRWCCEKGYRCGSSYGHCTLGAASVKVALVPLLIALSMAVASKYFL